MQDSRDCSELDLLQDISLKDYLAEARRKENVASVLFLSLDKHAEARKARAEKTDSIMYERLGRLAGTVCAQENNRGVNTASPSSKIRPRDVWLVGAELSAMMTQALVLSDYLIDAGHTVHLVSRLHPEKVHEYMKEFETQSYLGMAAGKTKPGSSYVALNAEQGPWPANELTGSAAEDSDVFTVKDLLSPDSLLGTLCAKENFHYHYVRPLEHYSDFISRKRKVNVISFYLPLSASLLLNGIKHVCMVNSLDDLEVVGKCGSQKVDTGLLAYMPDIIVSWDWDGWNLHRADNPLVGSNNSEVVAMLGQELMGQAGSRERLETRNRKVSPTTPATVEHILGGRFPPLAPSPGLPTLSACMIVKDEAGIIEDCLFSLISVADEVIVNDTGSQDDTLEIARAFGAKCFETQWENDFAKARNDSIERAHCKYILTIDADERVSKDSRPKVKLELLKGAEAYLVRISEIRGSISTDIGAIIRIFTNRPSHRYTGKVHEQVAMSIKGQTFNTSLSLDHVGYNPVISTIKQKRKRNVDLLLKEHYEEDSDLGKEYLLFQAGTEMLFSDDCVNGLTCLKQAYDITLVNAPFRPTIALRIADAYLVLDRVDDIVTFASEVLDDYPDFIEFALKVAGIMAGKGRFDEANDLLEGVKLQSSSVILPRSEGVDTFMLQTVLAQIQIGKENKDKAFGHIVNALRLNPDYGPAQRLLCLNWPEKLVEVLKQVNPKSVRPVVEQYIVLNKLSEAEELAVSFGDSSALGEVRVLQSDYAEAARCLLSSGDVWDRRRGLILIGAGLAEGLPGLDNLRDSLVDRVLQGLPCKIGEVEDVCKILGFLLDIRAMDKFFAAARSLDSISRGSVLVGNILYEHGHCSLAYRVLKGVAKGDIEVDTLLSGICQTLGLYDESRSHYEMIRTVRSLTSNEYVKYVEVLSKLRKFDEAGWLLGEAVDAYPENKAIGEMYALFGKMMPDVLSNPSAGK